MRFYAPKTRDVRLVQLGPDCQQEAGWFMTQIKISLNIVAKQQRVVICQPGDIAKIRLLLLFQDAPADYITASLSALMPQKSMSRLQLVENTSAGVFASWGKFFAQFLNFGLPALVTYDLWNRFLSFIAYI